MGVCTPERVLQCYMACKHWVELVFWVLHLGGTFWLRVEWVGRRKRSRQNQDGTRDPTLNAQPKTLNPLPGVNPVVLPS